MITEEDYVSFEVAKLLKEKGFTEECEYFYDWYKESESYHICSNGGTCNDEKYPDEYSMPTYQMAMKWLREIHKIHIVIQPICRKGYNAILCDIADFDDFNYIAETNFFFHPEEAVEAGLKYVLENLV